MFEFISKYWTYFVTGTVNTLLLSLIAVLVGTFLGFLLALVRMQNNIFRTFAIAYIEFIRGTPLLAQIFIIYFLPYPLFGINIDKFLAGAIALSLNSTAYIAEIVRAGINAIDKGQMEAARSLGMPKQLAMTEIILPQATKNILPALGNEFIAVIKESSLVYSIGVAELMYQQGTVSSTSYDGVKPLVIVSILYFIITFGLSKLLGVFENKLKESD